MKAWVLNGIGDLRMKETDKPKINDREVMVAVKAAGICGSDIQRVYETGAYRHPLIIGHEFSGEVVKVGKGVENEWLGQRVGICPLIPCGICISCKKGRYEMCRNYDYLGSRRNGGFAEFVAVPAANLVKLPDGVSYEEAAMLEPMAVAVHALRRNISSIHQTKAEGKKIAICGLGTIGLLMYSFLKEAGMSELLLIGNKDFQEQMVYNLGLPRDNYCDCRKNNVKQWIMEHTDGEGVELFFECVGKNETVIWAINAAASGGRICLVGNPYTEMLLEKNTYWQILRRQLFITGTWNSSFEYGHKTEKNDERVLTLKNSGEHMDDWQYALTRLEQKRILPSRLISHRFPLEELEQGFLTMHGREEHGKIMIVNEGESIFMGGAAGRTFGRP